MKVFTEGVVNSNSPDAIVQIVPNKDVIAKVYITNKDIGFVRIGQIVDVRIDTFNFSEFGDVKGTIEWIGSDALPPDQIYPFARFPAKIKLARQTLSMIRVKEIDVAEEIYFRLVSEEASFVELAPLPIKSVGFRIPPSSLGKIVLLSFIKSTTKKSF
jgi:HlyD family secretion protein